MARSARAGRIGVRDASQSLKSPTSDTVVACATRTNWNSRAAGIDGRCRAESRSTSAASPAAPAAPARGDKAKGRGRVSQRHPIAIAPGRRRAGSAEISRITRSSKPGSISTGRRTCRITRSTNSSRSDMLRLAENHLQLLAGALHPHLQRRNACTGEPCHRFVLQLLYVLEEERLAVLRGEAGQRPPDNVVKLRPFRGALERGAVQRGVVPHEQPRASRRAGARRPAPVDQNAVEPRPESLRIVAAREGAIAADEGILQGLLSVLPIPEHMHGVAAQAVAVASDERAVGAGVAAEHAAHQLGVARPHALYTHGGSPGVTIPRGRRSCDAGPARGGISGWRVLEPEGGRTPRCRSASFSPHCSRWPCSPCTAATEMTPPGRPMASRSPVSC